MDSFVSFFLILTSVYLSIGLIFGLFFSFKGVQQLDRNAKDSPLGFRLLILPGSVALWPVLLQKWRRKMKDGK